MKRKKNVPIDDGTVKLKIARTSYCEVTRERDSEDVWDADDTYCDHCFTGFAYITDKYWDFVINKNDFDKNATYYLVVVFYDTGDSFHRDENNAELVYLAKTREDANIIKNAIDSHAGKNSNLDHYGGSTALSITLPPNNSTITISASSWTGYFEHFRSCEIYDISITS